MQFKAIIFDLDGVICHTDHYHFQAWKQLVIGLASLSTRKTTTASGA